MAKILVWDIETSPMVATVWGLWKQNLSHDSILRDWYIISGAWKWLGKKKVHAAAIKSEDAADYLAGTGDAPDREVVEQLRAAVLEADIIVAHNGDAFDLKKLNTRLIHYGLEPLPPVRTVDTLKEARKVARFSSNRLDFLAKTLVGGGKIKTTFSLWLSVMHGDEKALKKMVRYNKRDVTELESVYVYLLPYMKNHPNVNLGTDGKVELVACPRCGSDDVQRRGHQKTKTRSYVRYQCQCCASWFGGTRSVSSVPVA